MPATAEKIATLAEVIDINEASAQRLREALPGIGEVLSKRIVAYREAHGPFADPTDLLEIPGVTEARVAKLAPRISVAPPASGHRPSAIPYSERPSLLENNGHTVRLFSIPSDALRGPAPSMASLMPSGPLESIRVSGYVSSPPAQHVGAAIVQDTSPLLETVRASAAEEHLSVPLHRPWRIWVVLGAIGFFSATVGAVFGIRSQDGGPRSGLERRVGRVQDEAADLKGAVGALEGQSSAFASSINALDARVTQQETKTETLAKKAAPPRVQRGPEAKTVETADDVKQALRQFDAMTVKR
jgi:competence ComEA-like helix-hairpin-helix protein